MNFGFVFIVMIIGVVIAVIQDIKRREIDRWLTFSLLFSGIFYLLVKIILNKSTSLLIQSIFVFGIMFIFSELLYYSKFFAGGDSSLLFSLSALFVGQTFLISILNILTFIIILCIVESFYGLMYSIILYFKKFKENNNEIKRIFKNSKIKYIFFISLSMLIVSCFSVYALPIALVLFLFPLLFSLIKSIEKNSLTKTISGSSLRVGDWLNENIKIGNKEIKSSFYGITQEEVNLLKYQKRVVIKEGIPFAPVFLISMVLCIFLFEKIFTFIFQFFI
jgi:Flp pilus assembly protein protease CpaA